MNKYLSYAYLLFAFSAIAFGSIQLITGNFNKGLFPVLSDVPAKTVLAYISGTTFVGLGCGIFLNKWRYFSSFLLGGFYFIFFVTLHLPKLFTNIYDPQTWTAAFEMLALCCGAFFIAKTFSSQKNEVEQFASVFNKIFHICRYSFALSLIVFGILHFKYAAFISTLISAWFPAKLFFAYFVGVAFILTAVSIIINIKIQLSTTLIGLMFLLWVIVLHLPRSISKMSEEAEWTSLMVALSIGSASFMLSYLSKKPNQAFQR